MQPFSEPETGSVDKLPLQDEVVKHVVCTVVKAGVKHTVGLSECFRS